jgi:hypothetical protein
MALQGLHPHHPQLYALDSLFHRRYLHGMHLRSLPRLPVTRCVYRLRPLFPSFPCLCIYISVVPNIIRHFCYGCKGCGWSRSHLGQRVAFTGLRSYLSQLGCVLQLSEHPTGTIVIVLHNGPYQRSLYQELDRQPKLLLNLRVRCAPQPELRRSTRFCAFRTFSAGMAYHGREVR